MKGPFRRNPFGRRASDPVPQEPEPTVVAPEVAAEPLPAGLAPEDVAPSRPSFRDRGRLRRRMRYLRRVRELGFRDLGGLVFDLHRFSQSNDDLVLGKLAALDGVDRELRAIERVLDERRDIIELREPGVAACPRCGALHGSDARYCPQCGTQFRGPLAMVEVGSTQHAGEPPPTAPPGPAGDPGDSPTPVSGALAGPPRPADAPTQAMPATPPPSGTGRQGDGDHAARDAPTPAATGGDPLAPGERPAS